MQGRGLFLGAKASPEKFPARRDKCTGSKRRLPQRHHRQTGGRIKRHLIKEACQKSRFKKPQFSCTAQEILWVITHNAGLGATAAFNYCPNSSFLCVTLLQSRTAPAQHCAGAETPPGTRGEAAEQFGREGAMGLSKTPEAQHRGSSSVAAAAPGAEHALCRGSGGD